LIDSRVPRLLLLLYSLFSHMLLACIRLLLLCHFVRAEPIISMIDTKVKEFGFLCLYICTYICTN
jgi:hypothetical protein